MLTMAHPATTFADVRHHPLVTAVLVSLFWIAAGTLVATCHVEIDPRSPSGGAAATIASIIVVAYAYTRLCARHAGISHALGVGSAWLVLAIVAELVIASRVGHGWYLLLGSPSRPLLRNIFLFVWIFAPALFAHGEIAE